MQLLREESVWILIVTHRSCRDCRLASRPRRANTDGLAGRHSDAIADEYVRDFTQTFPELAAIEGLPGADHSRLSDRSAAARRAWEGKQDALLARLAAVSPSLVLGSPGWVVHGQLREHLESAQS
jgi:hypothetical protein